MMNRYEIGTLRGYYGALLTGKQNEMLRLHYDEDISYGELSELFGISRQAVLDSIRRGEKSLEDFERKLKLADRDRELVAALVGAQAALEDGDSNLAAEKIADAKRLMEE